MAQIIDTANLSQTKDDLPLLVRELVYCGLDSCVTHEVHGKIHSQLDEETQIIYDFERALQAPVLDMMLRGILTDSYEVARLLDIYKKRRDRIYYIVQRFAEVIWEKELNPNSPKQLMEIFYTYMNIPPVYIFDKGKRRISVNREALEQIMTYRYARPLANSVLAYRGMTKKIGVLNSGIDDDKRMRFSYNIGGTNTGRFSCNENVFGGGTNGQNITDELRRIFVADEGKKLAYFDLEQAESRFTAYVSGEEKYIDACESGDLHVSVARDIWPDLDWSPNREPDHDKRVAEEKFFRHWTYRDLAKRGGHLTNYMGTAVSNAKALNISQEMMARFQFTYFDSFPGIRRYHGDMARELNISAIITTPMGRKRLFFGRNYADDVLRKAVAYQPQSGVGDLLNLGMWKVWKHLCLSGEVELLGQLHDAILIMYQDDPFTEKWIINRVTELMTIPVLVKDTKLRDSRERTMIIPVEAAVGWNWAKYNEKGNPDGLLKYGKLQKRQRLVSPSTDLLARLM